MNLPHWNLNLLYNPNEPELDAELENLKKRGREFAGKRAGLETVTPADFKNRVAELEAMTLLSHRLSGFAELNFSQNTQDQKALALMARVDEIMADLGNDLLFFEIWWKELADEKAAALLEAAPDFRYWLTRLRAYRRHTLPEDSEKILNLKNITGRDALIALYDSICNRYRFTVDFVPGEEPRQVSRDELMVHVRDENPEVRAGAYKTLYKKYGEEGPILAQVYQTRARDWRIENIRLRAYEKPADVRHKANDLSRESVEALLSAARKNAPLFREFFAVKAAELKLPRFSRYDLYAPLTADPRRWTFAEARADVLAAFADFSPDFERLAAKIMDEDHFSAAPMPGKQGGAFCASLTPGDTPWVLMTYNGRRQDVFTMAHELGHGIHSLLAGRHNCFHFHATLPLAETASTFGEMLLAKRFLDQAENPRERAALLFHLLDDAYATVGRQAYFALFEIKAHEMIEKGATAEELAEAYYQDLKEQFGPDVDIPDEFRWEWVSIPHFYHTPFYVYAYSFGQLLVYSLWRHYEREGRAFAPRLTSILSRGGSEAPEDILREAGLASLDENFWQGGFDVVKSFIAELQGALKG